MKRLALLTFVALTAAIGAVNAASAQTRPPGGGTTTTRVPEPTTLVLAGAGAAAAWAGKRLYSSRKK
jgi:PEP-CTERM motif